MTTGLKGIAFYLFVYAFMTIGAFTIVIVLRRRGLIGDEIEDMNGLIQRSPTAAVLLLIFMLSLAGIPPLAGFVGKYYILLSLIQTPLLPGDFWRALHRSGAVLLLPDRGARLAARACQLERCPAADNAGQSVALTAMCAVTIAAGIYPEPFIRLASYSLVLPAALFGR